MKLIYRGITYDNTPANAKTQRSVQSSEVTFDLAYRGCGYRIESTTVTADSQELNQYELIYRGTTYQVNPNGQRAVVVTTGFPRNSSKHRTVTTYPSM